MSPQWPPENWSWLLLFSFPFPWGCCERSFSPSQICRSVSVLLVTPLLRAQPGPGQWWAACWGMQSRYCFCLLLLCFREFLTGNFKRPRIISLSSSPLHVWCSRHPYLCKEKVQGWLGLPGIVAPPFVVLTTWTWGLFLLSLLLHVVGKKIL